MKKLISILLVSIIILGTFSVLSVSAEENVEIDTNIYTSKDGNYKYEKDYYIDYDYEYDEDVEEDPGPTVKLIGVSIIKYVGENKLPAKYTVPETIDGYDVSKINSRAFKKYHFTDVIINSEDISIGNEAFYGCKNLKSVTMDSVEYIGEKAFYNCKKLSSLKFKDKDCYAYVDSYAFYNCPKLKSAYISYNTDAMSYSFGYYDKASKRTKVPGFAFRINDHRFGYETNYAYEENIKCVAYLKSKPDNFNQAEVGDVYWLKLDGKSRSGWKSTDPDVIKITKNGKMTFLQTGEATIKLKLKNGETYKRKIKVGDYWGELPKFGASDYVNIKKGHTKKVLINGKVKSMKCVCLTKSKIAKMTCDKSTRYIKVKGLKKGKTTLKIKVNGVKTLKLKVTVK